MHPTRSAVHVLALLATAVLAAPVAAADGGLTIEALPASQQPLARRTLEFVARMERLYFERVQDLNAGKSTFETRNVETDSIAFDVRVARGDVVEKAGRMLSVSLRPNQRFPQERAFNRFLSFDVHPKSPLIGTMHAALSVNFNKDGSTSIGGWVDVMPGAMRDDDLATLRTAMDRIYEKHKQDPARYRKASCKGDPRHANKYRRRPACVGGSFYGEPALPITGANFEFVVDAYETFVTTYFDLVDERKDDPFTPADLASQQAMRLNWFEDRLYADPDTTTVTPYEVWSLSTLPPSVRF
jgi:coproporphyrinogen III oxidase